MSAPILLDFTEDDLIHEIMEQPHHGVVPMPDMQIIDQPGWFQVTTPSVRGGGLNGVHRAVLQDHEADATIDRTLAHYQALGLRFRWTVGPGSRPLDLGQRLAQRGLRAMAGLGMARPTAGAEPNPPGVHVELVDDASLVPYTEVTAAGWGTDPGPLMEVHRRMLAHGIQLFLGRWQGEPAGTGALVVFARSAYLLGGVVLPALRRRGVYRALVSARLRHAAARSVPLATVQSIAATSGPILTALGFQTICQYQSYLNYDL